MTRISVPLREQLTHSDQKIWDAIDRTRGGVWGPYSVLMNVPQLAERVASVGEYLRFHGKLSDQERELAILVAADNSNCQFEWAIHEPIARKAGISAETLHSICGNSKPQGLSYRQELLVEVVRELFETKTLSESLYAEAKAEFSEESLIELIVIAGFYRLLAFVLNAFDVHTPDSKVEG